MADTHIGEVLPETPPEIGRVLAGVDLILHAGDLSQRAVLTDLESIAPVAAVRGNHDREGRLDLPEARRLQIGAVRIGLVHGDAPRPLETAAALRSLVAGRPRLDGVLDRIARRMGDCDCVVFGHVHLPILTRRRGALLFSPGAVYVPEADPRGMDDSLRARIHLRVRAGLPAAARRPAVGVLEVHGARIRARVIPLRAPIRPEPDGGRANGGRSGSIAA